MKSKTKIIYTQNRNKQANKQCQKKHLFNS